MTPATSHVWRCSRATGRGRTCFYTAGNRLSNVTTTSGNVYVHFYDHDDEGNRTAKRDAAGTVIETYDYDAKNRLVALQAGAQVTTYSYDPFDYRIGVASGGEDTLYALEGEHVEAIYDGRGNAEATFLRGAVIDEIVGAYAYDARGRKTFSTYGHDRLTSVTRLTDHTGAAVQTYAYGALRRRPRQHRHQPQPLQVHRPRTRPERAVLLPGAVL